MNTLQIIQKVFGNNDVSEKWLEKQYEFAALIAEAEREACANICDLQMEISEINKYIAIGAGNCADAIRARGQG